MTNQISNTSDVVINVCNGDEYDLPPLHLFGISTPKAAGWYPVGDGRKLSFWDGSSWCQPISAAASAEAAGNAAEIKLNDILTFWSHPWWLDGPRNRMVLSGDAPQSVQNLDDGNEIPLTSNFNLIRDRYHVYPEGVVIDTLTNLMWMQCSLGQVGSSCKGAVRKFFWSNSRIAAKNLNLNDGFANYTDWRIPSLDELLSLVESNESPTICNEAFPNTPKTDFWTSTVEVIEIGNFAISVDFKNGHSGGTDRSRLFKNAFAVRLVRFSKK